LGSFCIKSLICKESSTVVEERGQLLDTGYSILDTGYWILDAGFSKPDDRCKTEDAGHKGIRAQEHKSKRCFISHKDAQNAQKATKNDQKSTLSGSFKS
jgi:hypothetical protein